MEKSNLHYVTNKPHKMNSFAISISKLLLAVQYYGSIAQQIELF